MEKEGLFSAFFSLKSGPGDLEELYLQLEGRTPPYLAGKPPRAGHSAQGQGICFFIKSRFRLGGVTKNEDLGRVHAYHERARGALGCSGMLQGRLEALPGRAGGVLETL